jgi:endonuclease/exonuclease/phosphatase family metal-dependent hydrolase
MTRYRRDFFRLLEAGLVGLFFVQAVRFLYATLYAHLSSASLSLVAAPALLASERGVVGPAEVEIQLLITAAALLAPLLSILLGRLWFGAGLAAVVVGIGRVFLSANGGTTFGVLGAAMAVGGGLLYLSIIAVRHPGVMPAMLPIGFAADQLIRLSNDTLDPTWGANFLEIQTGLGILMVVLAAAAILFERLAHQAEQEKAPNRLLGKGEIAPVAALAIGGLLYLQFAVFGLPNSLAHRAGLEYNALAPYLLAATLLPLVGAIRSGARAFLTIFDTRYRGWVWFLLVALLVAVGWRFEGNLAGAALIAAQFTISISFWWVAGLTDRKRNFTALAVMVGTLAFLLLTAAEYFSFEYAFVRGLREPFADILRSLRGNGLSVVLFAIFLMCVPAIVGRKRITWRSNGLAETLAALALVIGGGLLAWAFSRPIITQLPERANTFRVATLNLHSGFSQFFDTDLPALAAQIRQNGIDILLLQEVEVGRLVTGGVDQAAWLARNLGMQVAYFPTNEDLQGLAVLSRLPIKQSEGRLLSSRSKQTGVQFAQLATAENKRIDLYNVALTLIVQGLPLSTEAQSQDQIIQITQIIEYIEQTSGQATPVQILGGAFNHAPCIPGPCEGSIYTYLTEQRYVDPFAKYPQERAVTLRLVNAPAERVDYIWLRGPEASFLPLFIGVASIPQSNHDMPIVEIRIE